MKEIVFKECKKHGVTEHAYYNKVLRCKKCMVEQDFNKRHRIKSILVEYKGGKCEICGYDKCLNALDFHHINSQEKKFALNSANYNKSLSSLKEESDKCILVCANCHREIHYKENEERRKIIICEDIKIERAFSTLNIDDIKNDINNGLKQIDIAQKHKVSLSTIKRFYQKHNLTKKRFNCNKEVFLETFKRNPTYSYICNVYNITKKVARNFCVNKGLIEKMNSIRKEHGLKPLTNKNAYK